MPAPLFVILAAVCFGTTGTAQAFAPDGATSLSIGSSRLVAGGIALALISLPSLRATRGTSLGTSLGASLRASLWSSPRDRHGQPREPADPTHPVRTGHGVAGSPRSLPAAVVVVIGALGVLAYQPTFFAGARANGVAVGTVLALGSAPLFTGLLEWRWLGRRPHRRWFLATAIAVLGVALLAAGGASGEGGGPLGVAASLGAGASYALYAVAVKTLIDSRWSSTGAVGAVFGVGGLLALPIMVGTDLTWLASTRGLLVLAWLGGVTVVVAYLLYGAGLRRVAAATASTLTLAEPATAALLGLLVLGERLGALGWCGVVVVVLAIVVLTLPGRAPVGRG